jgi:hypothetical protein
MLLSHALTNKCVLLLLLRSYLVVVMFPDWEDESDFIMEIAGTTPIGDGEGRPAMTDTFRSLCTQLQHRLSEAIAAGTPAKSKSILSN